MERGSPCYSDSNSSHCREDDVLQASEDPNNNSSSSWYDNPPSVPPPSAGGGGSSEGTWPHVRQQLQWALPVHIYGFACLFFMLAFYTFFSILNLRSQISNRPFMSTINVFLCVLGVSRAACFLIDPYTSGEVPQVMPGFLGWVLWDVGYPCLLSAFSLIQLAFSQLTQVKFRPETLRRKSALSLAITTHFALVLGSDLVTAFESHLEVVRWVVQTVFLSWGLVLCLTFLYGGARIIRLLRTIPHSAFQATQQTTTENKGILQLALLAQCNNIASSVITSTAPSLLTPKIRITDEHDHTYSYLSSQGESAPASRRPSSRASITSELTIASPSGVRLAESEQSDIAEESEDQESSSMTGRRGREDSERRAGRRGSERSERSSKGSVKKRYGSEKRRSDVKGRRNERDGVTIEVENCNKTEKIGDIIIMVEDVGSSGTEYDNTRNEINYTNYDHEDIKFIDNGADTDIEHREADVESGDTFVERREVEETLSMSTNTSINPSTLNQVPSAKSLDSILRTDSASSKSQTSAIRKSSFSGLTSSTESDIKPAKAKTEEGETSHQLVAEGDIAPKRKKSLTWYEDTQSEQSTSPQQEKEREDRTPERETNPERSPTTKEPQHRRASSAAGGNRRSTRTSEKQKLRATKSYELGATRAVYELGADVSRRKSSSSSVASRKSSEHYQTLSGIAKDLKLTPTSPTGRRRSSRKSLKGETEAFISRHNSTADRGDLTLSSILNHIAYVNQTASAHKLPSSFKDSRKAQVQQVLLVTYITAALGTVLSLALVYGLYGNLASSVAFLRRPPWLWFTYESGCRFLEFLMGCAMANITRQPVNRHPQYPYSMHIKQRNSIYM